MAGISWTRLFWASVMNTSPAASTATASGRPSTALVAVSVGGHRLLGTQAGQHRSATIPGGPERVPVPDQPADGVGGFADLPHLVVAGVGDVQVPGTVQPDRAGRGHQRRVAGAPVA